MLNETLVSTKQKQCMKSGDEVLVTSLKCTFGPSDSIFATEGI